MSDSDLLQRIEAGRIAVLGQTALLQREFGRAESKWKHDGTRVTAVDVAISEAIVRYNIRGLGSATLHLAYVATGLFDGCIDFNVKIWDLAAAIPLVLAAGGEVRFLNGAQLPLRTFDLKMGRIVYVAGSAATCDRLQALMAGGGSRQTW